MFRSAETIVWPNWLHRRGAGLTHNSVVRNLLFIALAASSGCDHKKVAAPSPAPVSRGCETLPVFADGRESGRICPDEAARRGLVAVDLSDTWAPSLFRDDENPYRATYAALANERFGRGPDWQRARKDLFLELYGIAPSFRVLLARLSAEARFACHAAVDSGSLTALGPPLDVFHPPRSRRERMQVAALEARLVCAGLLPSEAPRKRWRIQDALEAYQRKHAVVSAGLVDRETRVVLAEDPRELEFRALLRALRARVVDATGLIEDGSARGERSLVLGRHIDADAAVDDGAEPLEEGAPDLIAAATEAAARALGWTDPGAAATFLRAHATESLRVALPLPRAPEYHSAAMDLRAEIDRGDVWYERPRDRGRVARRPTLTLWAKSGDQEIALVRWPTTIGGWKKEATAGGGVVLRYKNSDVGMRVWRDLVVLPAWLPPPLTPPRTLVRRGDDGGWLPDTDLVGPGYASAYGLVMLVHHHLITRGGETIVEDRGIRTHGSVTYQSIRRGESHGCHRLFNESAVRLASFLVAHHAHVRHGLDARPFSRLVKWKGHTVTLPIPHRGLRYELTPPIRVEVLEGHIRGKVRHAPKNALYVRNSTR
jgi:hypothetical protein